jgi:uncharacterized protein YbbC (DUF1343 family)
VAVRHGLTPGEILGLAARRDGTGDALRVLPMLGWERRMSFADTGLPWVLPSPNIPTADTALVYPGCCLLEATWASEGRGTTRPFELIGAPGVDGARLARRLEGFGLPGTGFRPVSFRPTFHKHAGRACGGVQLHVLDARAFLPYRTGVALLLALRDEAAPAFAWRDAPYEFVSDLPAIDLLAGSPAVREGLESGAGLDDLADTWKDGEGDFSENRMAFFLYNG